MSGFSVFDFYALDLFCLVRSNETNNQYFVYRYIFFILNQAGFYISAIFISYFPEIYLKISQKGNLISHIGNFSFLVGCLPLPSVAIPRFQIYSILTMSVLIYLCCLVFLNADFSLISNNYIEISSIYFY